MIQAIEKRGANKARVHCDSCSREAVDRVRPRLKTVFALEKERARKE